MQIKKNKDYLFGVNEYELKRLEFQHKVWKPVTDKFLSKLGIRHGWKCMDVGAGPGFVSEELIGKTGSSGEVTVLEPSSLYFNYFKNKAESKGRDNVKLINSLVEDAELPENYYDLIFGRWVITFAKDPEMFVSKLVGALKPGGILALQDYNYEGLSLFPRGGAFDKIPEYVKKYYKSEGGNPYVASLIPGIFRRQGLELNIYDPNCLAGGPESGITEWAHRFFITHIQLMADKGLYSQAEADAMLADWNTHLNNPDAVFFSPIVVDMAGVKRS
jgi:ubiquinone/menaquinone biosynthesis C-methylase UbiE